MKRDVKRVPIKRRSRQRQLVLDAVRKRCDHPTADQICADVRRQDGRISRGTVYRNLGVLAESGEISRIRLPDTDRYDLRAERHHHLLCTACGQVFDAPLPYRPAMDAQMEADTGFRISGHHILFEGLCRECEEARRQKG